MSKGLGRSKSLEGSSKGRKSEGLDYDGADFDLVP